ncbi:MAG TPA: DUF2252 family protein [Polyangiaceae bacterium]|nr:DUF2252 family protein [Polyangiaceae bacterium]
MVIERRGRNLLASSLCAVVVSACASATGGADVATAPTAIAAPPDASEPIAIPFVEADFAANEALERALVGSSFRYFRYVNGPFTRAVCARFASDVQSMPTVNLHGDAHVEQYAAAVDGRGLADFDAATLGPPIVDWMRFAASLWLAAGDDDAGARAAVEAFVKGYRASLADPDAKGPEPRVVTRLRAAWGTPAEWLDGVEKLMAPLDDAKKKHMELARANYMAAMRSQNPDLAESFFAMKRGGRLTVGIGSAHEEKMLMRVEGPTLAADDDVILETKQFVATESDCTRGDPDDVRRVIIGQARIGSPQRLLGTVRFDDRTYYVHAWRMHYDEVDVRDIRDASELAELAYDVGLQLGRGHPNGLDTDGKLRARLGEVLDREAPKMADDARALADRTKKGWAAFRKAACATHPVEGCSAGASERARQ